MDLESVAVGSKLHWYQEKLILAWEPPLWCMKGLQMPARWDFMSLLCPKMSDLVQERTPHCIWTVKSDS